VVAKHVLRYLQGTMGYDLDYVKGDQVRLIGCTDSYWDGNASDRDSTSRCFLLGSVVVSWFSRKQRSMALSSAEESTWQLVELVVRHYGFTRCFIDYLVRG